MPALGARFFIARSTYGCHIEFGVVGRAETARLDVGGAVDEQGEERVFNGVGGRFRVLGVNVVTAMMERVPPSIDSLALVAGGQQQQ